MKANQKENQKQADLDVEKRESDKNEKKIEKQKIKEDSDNQEEKEKSSEELKKEKKETDEDMEQKNQEPKEKSEVDRLKEKIQKVKRKYEKKLEMKEDELEEQKDKYMYLQAEMENTRKHYQKQIITEKEKAKADLISRFIPLLESFESAEETREKIREDACSDNMISFLEGFEKIYDSLRDIFKSLNVEAIEETGVKFDYNLHEVMMRVDKEEFDNNEVIQILQKGYKMDNKVIKPAKIIINKKPKKKKQKMPEKQEEEKEGNKSKKEEKAQKEQEFEKEEEKENKNETTDEKKENK